MSIFRRYSQAVFVILLTAGIIILAGCEDNDHSHKPPADQGSIIVDNQSLDIIHVYIDGYYTNDVGDYDYEAYDRLPGLYRVVLDQKGGSRSYSHDVDVLEGKLTVLEVWINEVDRRYNIRVYYE